MTTYYLKSISGTEGTGSGRTVWAASTTYAVGDRVVTTRSATAARQFKVYECTAITTGQSGGSEPTWDSTTGNTTTDGGVTWTARAPTSWANAHMFMDMWAQGDAGGDVLYVSNNHEETSSTDLTIRFAGSAASPTKVICVDDSAEPPTAVATTAVVATSGASLLKLTGTNVYLYGIEFSQGSGASNNNFQLVASSSSRFTFERCNLTFGMSGAGALFLASEDGGNITLRDCIVTFNNASQRFAASASKIRLEGVTLAGTAINTLFGSVTGSGTYVVDFFGCDLSAAATAMNLGSGSAPGVRLTVANSKVPASWSGGLASSFTSVTTRIVMLNTDDSDTNYRVCVQDYYGQLNDETTLVRTSGASDGTTALAWKIVTTANAAFAFPFVTHDVQFWCEETGSKTFTCEILHDSATDLTDAEIWLEVMTLSTSGYPLGTWSSDRAADILATPADQASSSETWTTTGMTNPNTQKLSVTATVEEKGIVLARVCVAKASTTVYVCPKLAVS